MPEANSVPPNALPLPLLEAVMPRLLSQPGALPEDWLAEATTYDLPRFDSEAQFLQRLARALERIQQEHIQAADTLRQLLAACGHPYDYARLGHPLATVYEAWLCALSGASRAISFASATKPFLAVFEALRAPEPLRIFARARLGLSPARRQTLLAAQVALFENWSGPIPAGPELTLYVADGPLTPGLLNQSVDAVCLPVRNGGVLLLKSLERFDPEALQLIRKRTVAALLAADALEGLRQLAGLPREPEVQISPQRCDQLLQDLFPELQASGYFCTGLAAEAAVFQAVAETFDRPLRLFHAQNGYGGTGQLIAELLPRQHPILPMPLPVLSRGADGRSLTLVDRLLAELEQLAGEPAAIFLETPTNPELQVHDFDRLRAALEAYRERWGREIPLLIDTTLAPLFPVFARPFSQGWPVLLVKSGSKYFTKGKATLGLVACGPSPAAQAILARALIAGRDADAFAKPSQLAALAAGLADLRPRMAKIAANTRRLAEGLRSALRIYGHDITLYSISDTQLAQGLASGILSFYLPPAPTTHADLVDEFVAYLLEQAPELVRNRVSYGQSSGGERDLFYVINPEESTQGALPAEVKAAQKQDDVQICRISVPEHADVDGLLQVMQGFFAQKYA